MPQDGERWERKSKIPVPALGSISPSDPKWEKSALGAGTTPGEDMADSVLRLTGWRTQRLRSAAVR